MILKDLRALVLSNDCKLEVETRFGKWDEDNRTWKNGVQHSDFKIIDQELRSAISNDPKWTEPKRNLFVTFLYDNNVRFRVYEDGNREYQLKTNLLTYTVITGTLYDFKVCVSTEKKIHGNNVREDPKMLRLHQRSIFSYDACSHYHLTAVATGKTKEEACGNPPVYELEIEVERANRNELLLVIQRSFQMCGIFDENGNEIPLKPTILS
jgi:hypothetical protein